MNKDIDVYISVGENGKIPCKGSNLAAGYDVYASEDIILKPGETKLIPLNITVALPEGIEMQVRPRSGLSLKTELIVKFGTVDPDYRGIVGVIAQNTYNVANLPFEIVSKPNLLNDLIKENYKLVSVSEYLVNQTGFGLGYYIPACPERKKFEEFFNQKILVDQNDNPYGTIYIKKGERIAQVIFAKYLDVNFIPYDSIEKIGENRGGGFGSTGLK